MGIQVDTKCDSRYHMPQITRTDTRSEWKMSGEKPNILVLMTDQQRLDTISSYGLNPICRTPHVDGLAEKGIRFSHAFTPTAICSPARASFYTGMYPHHHGVTENGLCLNEGVKGVNHYLEEAGYNNGYAGKWHVDEERTPTDCGFKGKDFLGYAFPASGVLPGLTFGSPPKNSPNPYEVYLDELGCELPEVTKRFVGNNPNCNTQEMFALHDGPVESCIEYFVAEETNRLLESFAGEDKPFFLWSNFWGPHTPCLIPEPYFSMYDPKEIPEHPSYCETFEGKPFVQRHIEKMWGLGEYGWEGFREIVARYYGHCTLIDDMVGRILGTLDRLGIADNTVVIFTTDHGDCLGAHKLIEKGEFMYDEIYRIPLVVSHPDCRAAGSVNDDFVYFHEVTCSALEMAGLPVPESMDGESFLPAMIGASGPNGRDEVFCVFDRHFTIANQRMVRTRRHQLTFNSSDTGEIYDLEIDPYQLDNRYHDPNYASVRSDLLNRMERYMTDLGDPVYSWFRRIASEA